MIGGQTAAVVDHPDAPAFGQPDDGETRQDFLQLLPAPRRQGGNGGEVEVERLDAPQVGRLLDVGVEAQVDDRLERFVPRERVDLQRRSLGDEKVVDHVLVDRQGFLAFVEGGFGDRHLSSPQALFGFHCVFFCV